MQQSMHIYGQVMVGLGLHILQLHLILPVSTSTCRPMMTNVLVSVWTSVDSTSHFWFYGCPARVPETWSQCGWPGLKQKCCVSTSLVFANRFSAKAKRIKEDQT